MPIKYYRPTPRALRALQAAIKDLDYNTIHHSLRGQIGDRCLGVVMPHKEYLSFGCEVLEHFFHNTLDKLPADWTLPSKAKNDLLQEIGEIAALFNHAEKDSLGIDQCVVYFRQIPYPLTPELT